MNFNWKYLLLLALLINLSQCMTRVPMTTTSFHGSVMPRNHFYWNDEEAGRSVYTLTHAYFQFGSGKFAESSINADIVTASSLGAAVENQLSCTGIVNTDDLPGHDACGGESAPKVGGDMGFTSDMSLLVAGKHNRNGGNPSINVIQRQPDGTYLVVKSFKGTGSQNSASNLGWEVALTKDGLLIVGTYNGGLLVWENPSGDAVSWTQTAALSMSAQCKRPRLADYNDVYVLSCGNGKIYQLNIADKSAGWLEVFNLVSETTVNIATKYSDMDETGTLALFYPCCVRHRHNTPEVAAGPDNVAYLAERDLSTGIWSFVRTFSSFSGFTDRSAVLTYKGNRVFHFTGTSVDVYDRNDWNTIADTVGFSDPYWNQMVPNAHGTEMFTAPNNNRKNQYFYNIAPSCGDGIVQGAEECDDGNLVDGDDCTNMCLFSTSCNQPDSYISSGTCNSQGFCIDNVCSCAPGFFGEYCDLTLTECATPNDVTQNSNFAPVLSSSISNGDLKVEIELDIENSVDANRAVFTTITFESDDTEPVCAYPQNILTSGATQWTKTAVGCSETYVLEDDFSSQLSNCLERTCFESDGVTEVADCNNALCTSPPCTKVFSSTVVIERGYVKENGRIAEEVSYSSEHTLLVEFPWVQNVIGVPVNLVSVPELQNNFIIEDFFFDSDTKEWTIQLLGEVLYPWKVQGSVTFTTDPSETVTIEDISCAASDDSCRQRITITLSGCDALSVTGTDFTAANLFYTCNDVDCPSGGDIPAQLSFTLRTFSTCDVLVDAAPVTVSLNTFDSDYTSERKSFIYSTTSSQSVFFKVTATSTGEPVVDINLITIIDSNNVDHTSSVVLSDCNPDLCFSIPAEDLVGSSADDGVAVQDITYTSLVELEFSDASAPLKRSLLQLEPAKTVVTFVFQEEEEVDNATLLFATGLLALAFI